MFKGLETDSAWNGLGVEVLSRDPWVVQFNSFINHEEAQALITQQTQWQQSQVKDYSGARGFLTEQGRTSSSSFCFSECESHPLVAPVLARIEAITGLPRVAHESMQVLKC